MAKIYHIQRGSLHVVLVDGLHVMLLPTNDIPGVWFAQGMEIDYVAQGNGVEQAKFNFAWGLRYMIREHLCSPRGLPDYINGWRGQYLLDDLNQWQPTAHARVWGEYRRGVSDRGEPIVRMTLSQTTFYRQSPRT